MSAPGAKRLGGPLDPPPTSLQRLPSSSAAAYKRYPLATPPAGPDDEELDAADALLNMDSHTRPPAPDLTRLESRSPNAIFKPGTIVWAKIEGHDWWPGQVVRRRAVPREDVGPPPGGPTNVMHCFPVVFMNRNGVPPEVVERLDTREGALAASLRVHKVATGNEELEAEYAWVTADSLRPFRIGNHDLVSSELAVNSELATCVAAAEQAATAWQALADDVPYDSDGGWGHAQQDGGDPAAHGGHSRRPRGTRSRGGRRVRNRRSGHAAADDDPGYYDNSVAFYGPKIVVDSILGWRYPLTPAEAQKRQEAQEAAERERLAHLHALLRDQNAGGGGSDAAAGADTPGACGPATPSHEFEDAALLLGFTKESTSRIIDSDDAKAQPQPAAAPELGSGGEEREFLIKWADRSHIRNEWVPESRVMSLAKRKLLNFTKKYGDKPVDMTDPQWVVPERFVARRKCPYGPGWEILVKWKDLGYECCTWESDTDNVILDPRYLHLLTDFWVRQHACLLRSRSSSAQVFQARLAAAAAALPRPLPPTYVDPPMPKPDYIKHNLEPHQLGGAAMLRRMYIAGHDCIIADDPALGMVATMITFLQVIRHEFQPAKPMLVIVPGGALQYWKGEVEYWMGDDSDVILYMGPPGARARIAEAELWLQPGALSGKVPRPDEDISERFSKPQVVITSMESMLQDLEELKAVPWDLVVLDERHASKSFAHKMYPVLLELHPRLRVSMRDASGDYTPEELLAWAAFIKPHLKDTHHLLPTASAADHASVVEALKAEVLPYVRRTRRKDLPDSCTPRLELQLAVPLSVVQAECYRMTLARQFEQLGNHKAQRHSGQRASMLRSLCADICRVCNHPYTLPDYEPEADSQLSDADYLQGSGKLTALQMLLDLLGEFGKRRIVIAAHSSLDVLDDYLRIRYKNPKAFHRVDESTSAKVRAQAIDEFNSDSHPTNLMILEVSACSLGTDLKAADAVIIYDSDGHPSGDVQSLGFARHMGNKDKLLLFRLYCSGTLEECIVSGGYGAPALGKALRPTTHRLSAADARLLEESLRFGVPKLFEHECEPLSAAEENALKGDSAGGGSGSLGPMATRKGPLAQPSGDNSAGAHGSAAGPAEEGDSADGGSTASRARGSDEDMDDEEGRHSEREGTSASVPIIAQEPPALRPRITSMVTKDQLKGMLAALDGLLQTALELAPHQNLNTDPDALPEALKGAFVVDWRALRDGDLHSNSHYNARSTAVDDEEDEEHAEDEEEGVDKLSVSALASSSAAFWQRMLRNRYERLKQEDMEGGADQDGEDGNDRSGSADLEEGGAMLENGPHEAAHNGVSGDADAALDDGEVGSRRTGVRGSARVRRPTKRKQEDDSSPPPAQPPLRESLLHLNGDALHLDAAAPKRRRTAPPSQQPSAEQLRIAKLRRQYETVMSGLQEPSSLISGIFTRAAERLRMMAVDLNVEADDPSGQSTLNYAMQAAQILLIMRPINELPSDFQDYTLIALLAVAANLSSHTLGSEQGIQALAAKYHQSASDLKSVFNHIMGELGEYRTSILQIRQLEGESAAQTFSTLSPAPPPELSGISKPMQLNSLPPTHSIGNGAAEPQVRQVDVFAAELEAIVGMPTEQAATKLGPLPPELADYEHAINWSRRIENMPAGGGPDMKSLAEKMQLNATLKRSLTVLDLAHKYKIDAVQMKYQQHMESVRSRAQSSIDAVNQRYKQEKAQLEASLQLTAGGTASPKVMHHSMHPMLHQGNPFLTSGPIQAMGLSGLDPAALSGGQMDDSRGERVGGLGCLGPHGLLQ